MTTQRDAALAAATRHERRMQRERAARNASLAKAYEHGATLVECAEACDLSPEGVRKMIMTHNQGV